MNADHAREQFTDVPVGHAADVQLQLLPHLVDRPRDRQPRAFGGVANGFVFVAFLAAAGDRVEVSISGIGSLSNPVTAASA